MRTTIDYKAELRECGWGEEFLNIIDTWEAEMLTGIKDPDYQFMYADYLADKYKYEGEYFDE